MAKPKYEPVELTDPITKSIMTCLENLSARQVEIVKKLKAINRKLKKMNQK